MSKFFITEYALNVGGTAYIVGNDAKHIKKSLRMKPEEKLQICDGQGRDYIARINKIENDAVLVDVVAELDKNGEPGIKVNLFTAITKGEGFEYSIKKCVEAGVNSITPLQTDRTVVKIPDSKIDRRNERWNKIAEGASKQSGRSLIPFVAYPVDFQTALDKIKPGELTLICYVGEGSSSVKEAFKTSPDAKVINVLIGPEGGFTKNEWESAVQNGAFSVTLGKRILKAETAGFFVTVAAMYEYGEIDKK